MINKIGVIGAGQMGSGIVQVIAQSGMNVLMMDVDESALNRALKTIESSCDRMIKKERLTIENKTELLKRIQTTLSMSDLFDCEVVIEAATENMDLKIKIFKELDQIMPEGAYLFTNTSSLSITKIAAQTKRPDKVAGMHFMNPVPVMKLVECIRGLQTSDETFDLVRQLTERLNKVFVPSDKDVPGFIVNRILMPMINEAAYVLHEGIAQAKSIDEAMTLGTNQPMGPLAVADLIGLDTCLAIMESLHNGLGDTKYRPCPLLVKYVEAGWLGRKTLRGFYQYS